MSRRETNRDLISYLALLQVFRNIGSCGVIRNSVSSAGPRLVPGDLQTDRNARHKPEELLSLGLAKQLIGAGVRVYEVAFWVGPPAPLLILYQSSQLTCTPSISQDPTPTEALARTSRARSCPDFIDVQDRYTLLIHQGIIEREMMREISSRMVHNHYSAIAEPTHLAAGGVERRTRFVSHQILKDGGEYPVESIIERDGKQETVRSKYLIGSDGARSTVRKSIGKDRVALAGKESDVCWGVMDCVVDSDFRS